MKKLFYFLKNAWLKFAKILGFINTKIILSILFIFIFGIYGIFKKIIQLFKNKKKTTNWAAYKQKHSTIQSLKNQF